MSTPTHASTMQPTATTTNGLNLKHELKHKLLNDMVLPARKLSNSPALILVVDLHTTRILSSALRMYDILSSGIVAVEPITKRRERIDLPAIYFLTPTPASIDALLKDFSDPKHSQYSSAYLYWTSTVPSTLIQSITTHKLLMQKVQTFVELNTDWIATESRVFMFDSAINDNPIAQIYLSPQERMVDPLSNAARQLVSLCLTLREFPYIRYSTTGRAGLCKAFAQFFDQEWKDTVMRLTTWEGDNIRERGTVLIVDRTIDLVSPLMHEVTYQSLINDVMRVRGELAYLPTGQGATYTSQDSTSNQDPKNQCVLSEDDSLWVQLRHQHIYTVNKAITNELQQLRQTSRTAQFQTAGNTQPQSMKDMLAAVQDLPEYKAVVNRLSKHITVAQPAIARFSSKQLKFIAELEQDMAVGVTEDGNRVKSSQLKEQLQRILAEPIGRLERIRLLLLYVITQGAPTDPLKSELYRDLPPDLQQAVNGLQRLGIDLNVASATSTAFHQRRASVSAPQSQSELTLMRWQPYLQHLMEKVVNYDLNDDEYPYIMPPQDEVLDAARVANNLRQRKRQTGRSQATGDWRNETSADAVDTRPLFIIYVLGGVTHSEIRAAYEVAAKLDVNILIGSTNTVTGAEFVRQISQLSINRFKAALSPSGGRNVDDEVEDTNATIQAFDAVAIDIDNHRATQNSNGTARR